MVNVCRHPTPTVQASAQAPASVCISTQNRLTLAARGLEGRGSSGWHQDGWRQTPVLPVMAACLGVEVEGKDVSARVSPVVLTRGPPRQRRGRPHNCGYGELPRRRALPLRGQGRAGVLPFRAGTFCLGARGLSPSIWNCAGVSAGVLRWPFALRPYLSAGFIPRFSVRCARQREGGGRLLRLLRTVLRSADLQIEKGVQAKISTHKCMIEQAARQPKTVRQQRPEQRVAGMHPGGLAIVTAAKGQARHWAGEERQDCSTAQNCQAAKA